MREHIILNLHIHPDTGILFHHNIPYRTHVNPGIPHIVAFLEAIDIAEYRRDLEGRPENILFAPYEVGHNKDQKAAKDHEYPELYELRT
jgi:hypothetical protein